MPRLQVCVHHERLPHKRSLSCRTTRLTAPLTKCFVSSELSCICPVCAQIECCIRCLSQGVKAAHIIDGRASHSILMELLTDEGVGTMITG